MADAREGALSDEQREIDIIGCQMDLGAGRRGVDMGPSALRVAHLGDRLEALGPRGYYDTFGPELGFGRALKKKVRGPFAIAKFTHSGSQIVDWTPEGSEAVSRNLYPDFLAFVRNAVSDLEAKGHAVELAGIFYHVGENDMSFGPYRRDAPMRVQSLVRQSRVDLDLPGLRWQHGAKASMRNYTRR